MAGAVLVRFGVRVVQNNGAVQVAANKEEDGVVTPTPDSNNTIAGVLNGGLWAK